MQPWLSKKKAHYLKLYQEESLDTVVGQMFKHLGFIVAAHLQFLVFAFALKNVDSVAWSSLCCTFCVWNLGGGRDENSLEARDHGK